MLKVGNDKEIESSQPLPVNPHSGENKNKKLVFFSHFIEIFIFLEGKNEEKAQFIRVKYKYFSYSSYILCFLLILVKVGEFNFLRELWENRSPSLWVMQKLAFCN